MPATVSCTDVRRFSLVELTQLTEELEVQALVEQALIVCIDELVKSYDPKFKPVTVMDPAPLPGALVKPYEATGASNVRTDMPVPATAATVTAAVRSASVSPAFVMQEADVELLQVLVAH
jgi:hypothetical protein